MKALIYKGDETLELVDYPKIAPKAGQVMIKVSRAAICGTDLHKFRDSADSISLIDGNYPIAGHEPSGWVSQLGEGVVGLAEGQRVLIAGVFSCGGCIQCRSGFNTACEKEISGFHWNAHGCNTEYITVPASNVLPIPDSISFDKATVLTCAGGTAMTIVEETGLTSGQRLAVVGLGPVGLSTLIIAKSMGVKVVGIDISTERLEIAKKFGADLVIDSSNGNVEEEVSQWSEGLMCNAVAECVGRAVTQTLSIALAGNRGKVALAGLGDDKVPTDALSSLIGKGGLTLVGIAATPIKYMIKLIDITAKSDLPFDEMITHHFSLEEMHEALKVMESGNCGKIVLDIAEEY